MSRDCVEFLRAVGDSLHLASVSDGRAELDDAVYEGSLVNKKPMGQGTGTLTKIADDAEMPVETVAGNFEKWDATNIYS